MSAVMLLGVGDNFSPSVSSTMHIFHVLLHGHGRNGTEGAKTLKAHALRYPASSPSECHKMP
eukprot:6328964-Amphidinium_carterae.1